MRLVRLLKEWWPRSRFVRGSEARSQKPRTKAVGALHGASDVCVNKIIAQESHAERYRLHASRRWQSQHNIIVASSYAPPGPKPRISSSCSRLRRVPLATSERFARNSRRILAARSLRFCGTESAISRAFRSRSDWVASASTSGFFRFRAIILPFHLKGYHSIATTPAPYSIIVSHAKHLPKYQPE